MKRITILLLAVPLVLTACSGASRGSRTELREEWQTSWIKFVQEVHDFRKQHQGESQQVPTTTWNMTSYGQRVPEDWGIMKRFGRTVEFEGTLKGTLRPSEKNKLMEGQSMKLDLAMPTDFPKPLEEFGGVLVHAYPKSSTEATWEKAPVGAKVRFRATITGVAVFDMPIRGGLYQYHVLLEDAEPLQ